MPVHKITIPRSKWDALDEDAKKLATKMGISPEPLKSSDPDLEPRKRQSRTCELKAYTLGIIIECQLCKEIHIDLYNMLRCSKNGSVYLESRRSTEPECIPDHWSTRKVSSCKNCHVHLRKWSKKELIDKILEQAIYSKYFKSKPTETKPRAQDHS